MDSFVSKAHSGMRIERELIIDNDILMRDEGQKKDREVTLKKRGRDENEEAKGGKAMIKRTKMDQQLQDKEIKGEQEDPKACSRGPIIVKIKLNPPNSVPNPAKVEATRKITSKKPMRREVKAKIPMRRKVKSKVTKQLETSMTMKIECEPVNKVKGGNKVVVHTNVGREAPAQFLSFSDAPRTTAPKHVKTSKISNAWLSDMVLLHKRKELLW
ncbi:hypothetical protein SELMODRAFT_416100 [Selaginella moellendorffii]|uniref:Uncharacterized protein n=1 Tax=Selaginella moellendorffii TaxID=88036 RepID=D8RY30_SELML|nr:hypothetical protein SELMODRAFT_416100 [Selaginella moellendorffii]